MIVWMPSLYRRNATSIRNAWRYPRSSRNVSRTRRNATRTAFSWPVSSASRAAGGSGTRRSSGIENTSHQMPTLTNDSLVAADASGSPKVVGARIHGEVQGEQDAAAKKPDSVCGRRHAVDLGRRRDVGQQ